MMLDKIWPKRQSPDSKKIEKTAQKLIGFLDPEAEIKLNDNTLEIETEISGLLIGRHGETMQALQHILRVILAKELENFSPIMIDISGYRKNRAIELEEMARRAAEKVVNFGGKESLPPMNSFERRQVHMILQEIEGIESFSEGEEPERRIVIRPKK